MCVCAHAGVCGAHTKHILSSLSCLLSFQRPVAAASFVSAAASVHVRPAAITALHDTATYKSEVVFFFQQ